MSSTGVNKNKVKNPLNIYRSVLETGQPVSVDNMGFRVYAPFI